GPDTPTNSKRRTPIPARAAIFAGQISDLLVAADEAGDFPATPFLAVAELVVAEGVQGLGRDETGLAGRRDHPQHRAGLGVLVLHHAHEIARERFAHL